MTKFKMRVFLTLFSLILLAISASAETTSNTTYSAEVQTTAGGAVNTCSGTYCADAYVDAVSGQISNSTYTVQLGGASSGADQNVVLTIKAPITGSTSTSSTVALTYAVVHDSDINFVKNFWVTSGGSTGTYTNKNLTLTHSFTSLSNATYSLCVKATKRNDLNTTPVCVSVTVNVPAAATITDTTTSTGSTFWSNGEEEETTGGEPTLTSEVILFEQTISSDTLTEEDIVAILEQVGADEAIVKAAKELSGKLTIDRTLKVVERTYSDNTKEKVTLITLTITNTTAMDYTNIIVVEYIPKAVAESASLLLKGLDDFEILLEDPIVQFTITELKAGESATLSYGVNKEVAEESLSEWTASFASTADEVVNLCENVICKSTKCKPAKCSPLTGKCKYSYAKEGTECEGTKMCDGLGQCIEKPVPGVPATGQAELPKTQTDYTLVSGIVVVLIVLGAAAYFMTKKKKKDEKFTYKK